MDRLSLLIRKNKRALVLILLLAAVLVAIIVSLISNNPHISNQEIEDGVEYLKQLESKDINSVKPKVAEYRRQERRRLLQEGSISIWDFFEDYVVLGDSRAVGFYFHEFLDEDRCFAFGGATIRDIETYIEDLKVLNPRYIFLCFGLNDVGIGYWETPEEYADEFGVIIDNLKKELPDSIIVISSILIARDPAFEDNSAWYDIPYFNEAVMQMCIEKGIKYVDNSDLEYEYPDLWDVDGIHLKKDFYALWASNLIAEVEEIE